MQKHIDRSPSRQMSFGTIFWSTEPEKVWAVIDTMIELGIPFVCYLPYKLDDR